MVFDSSRLVVRQLTMDDFEDFYLLNSDEEVMRYIRPAKNREEALLFLQENIDYYSQKPEFGRWAITEKPNQNFIGVFMINPSRICKGEIELGYSFLKNAWGNGFATEAVIAGMKYAFLKLGIHQLVAITHPENKGSQHVLLKSGFSFWGDMDENDRIVNLFKAKNNLNGRDKSVDHLSADL